MDKESLNQILLDTNNRQFWIVLWGYPEHSPDEDKQIFNEPFYDEGLTQNVQDMRIGDILFVHRIHISKIIYVSEVIAPPRKSTAEESVKEEWRKRWIWSVSAKNLTPEYGKYWRGCAERTFTLAKQFNELHPDGPINVRRLNYGRHIKIPQAFAEFLLKAIKNLEVPR
jgi:hypothetical protein